MITKGFKSLPASRMHGRLFILVSVFFVWLISLAWVYPEHREISMIAIYDLDPDRRQVLAELWASARLGYENRLNALPADSTLGENPTSIDFAAWPAIAGDHSCSSEILLYNVLETDWILGVADVAARLKRRLNEAGWERHHRINVLRDSDIALQTVDKAYATRAGSNNVHFLLARSDVNTDAMTYLSGCLKEGVESNAIGAYAWFHLSALIKASQLKNQDLTAEEHSSLARRFWPMKRLPFILSRMFLLQDMSPVPGGMPPYAKAPMITIMKWVLLSAHGMVNQSYCLAMLGCARKMPPVRPGWYVQALNRFWMLRMGKTPARLQMLKKRY